MNLIRNRAQQLAALAERRLARGDDGPLVAALVRAAWRAHEKADADALPDWLRAYC